MTRRSLTQARLKALLRYDRETGLFTRLVTVANQRAGTIAGNLKPDGYYVIKVDRVTYQAGRLGWLYVTGEWPNPEVDHIDTIRSNNRWRNLRIATKAQNKRNSKMRSDSKNKFKGVKREKNGRYGARIWVDGTMIYLGCFENEERAAAIYRSAAAKHFGEFARA